MVKVFNAVAVLVRAFRASTQAATAQLRKDGHLFVPAAKEIISAYGKSDLPAELAAYEEFNRRENNNPPAWSNELIALFNKAKR